MLMLASTILHMCVLGKCLQVHVKELENMLEDEKGFYNLLMVKSVANAEWVRELACMVPPRNLPFPIFKVRYPEI